MPIEAFLSRQWNIPCKLSQNHTLWSPSSFCHHVISKHMINTLRPNQDGRHFPDDIFLNENAWILINVSLNFVPKVPIHNMLALIQIMAWHQQSDKPSSEPMMVSLLMHICVTRSQWISNVKWARPCPHSWWHQILIPFQCWEMTRKMITLLSFYSSPESQDPVINISLTSMWPFCIRWCGSSDICYYIWNQFNQELLITAVKHQCHQYPMPIEGWWMVWPPAEHQPGNMGFIST